MANSIIRYPLPLAGLNTVNPYADYDSGFARELTNYAIFNGRLFLRPQINNDSFNSTVANGAPRIRWFDPNTATRDSVLSDGTIINYTTNTPIAGTMTFVSAQLSTVTFSGTATTLDLVLGMGRSGTTQPVTKASPFAAAGPQASAAMGIPGMAASHKGRLYYGRGTRIEFGNVGQVAGPIPAANFVDIEHFLDGQFIIRLFSISASPGEAPSQSLFVVFGDGGKVLVFEGDNPSSATWNLIADHDMPAPTGAAGFLEIDGDIFVCTTRYAYWFRDLFLSGAQTAYNNSPSIPVENLWQSLTWTVTGSAPNTAHVWYYPLLDAIVCQCAEKQSLSEIFDYSNEACSLVYFRKYKAWALWGTTPFFFPVITVDDVPHGLDYKAAIFEMPNNIAGQRRDSYLDFDGANYVLGLKRVESSWKTPFAFLEKGIGLTLKSARAWVEVRESESTASIYKTRSIFDYSDLNAPFGFFTQSTVFPINPGRYTESAITFENVVGHQYAPLLPLGGDGGGVSLQISFAGWDELPDPGFHGGWYHSIYGLSALVQQGSEIF